MLLKQFLRKATGATKAGEQSPPWRIEIGIACLRTILEMSPRPSAIAALVIETQPTYLPS